jgi:transposase
VSGTGRAVRLQLTPGQAGDAPRAEALLDGLRPRHVVADAAYDSDAIRGMIRENKGTACIRPNPTRLVTKRYDRARYKNRNVIERFFGAIKRFRRVATRYDKKAENFLGFAWLAALLVGHLNVHTT